MAASSPGQQQRWAARRRTTTTRTTPVPVEGIGGAGTLTGVVAVAGGGYHSLALRSDGTVVAWGYNGDGELGNGLLTSRATPGLVKDISGVGPLTGVVAIAASQESSMALRADGTVVAWGTYPGDGSTLKPLPVQVSGLGGLGQLGGVVAIAAGGEHGLALRSDGSVVAGARIPSASWATEPPRPASHRCRSRGSPAQAS